MKEGYIIDRNDIKYRGEIIIKCVCCLLAVCDNISSTSDLSFVVYIFGEI